MRFCRILAPMLLCVARHCWAAEDKAGAVDSVLPATIPGYELRTLDVSKLVLFNVNGTWVQASVPIFFYYPTSRHADTARILRQIYGDLMALGRKPEWTAAELQEVIAKLDSAIRLLEPPPRSGDAAPKS